MGAAGKIAGPGSGDGSCATGFAFLIPHYIHCHKLQSGFSKTPANRRLRGSAWLWRRSAEGFLPKDELVDDFVRALVDLPPSESGDEVRVLAVAAFDPERVVVAEIGGSQRMGWFANDGAERGCGESVAERVAFALVEEPVAEAFSALAWLEDGFAEVADGLGQNAGIEEWLLECLVGIGQRHGGRRADDPVRLDGQNDEAES